MQVRRRENDDVKAMGRPRTFRFQSIFESTRPIVPFGVGLYELWPTFSSELWPI